MTQPDLFEPLILARGPALKNRFVLAPLTNTQSHPDGVMSEDEFRWLTLRAKGGFGLVLTAASHVQAVGQGFPGQIGVFGDEHLEGLARLAAAIKAEGAVAGIQLHHAGNRTPTSLAEPVAPSDDPKTGARGLDLGEVEALRDDFIAAAKRAEQAGFDGVEIHGAHGYILAQFLSAEVNHRDDRYGGTIENRARIIFEIIDGVRAACRPDFQLGLRLSGERFGLKLGEIRDVAGEILRQEKIDYFELSAWDVGKEPNEPEFQGRSLVSYFTELPRGKVRVGAAGKVMDGQFAAALIAAGCDFAVIGRAAILRHDFPRRVRADPAYRSPPLPVSPEWLRAEGLGPAFIDYLGSFPGFVGESDRRFSHDQAMGVWLKSDG
ncbi:MAG TPA: NADH:flavin oxidoreductase [Caulobacteraceae bacterium]|jgi:2,4-dienoyl-CoA reductase-like NADH-dependent reductase (Old Yellow Enzyme family)|nr:NADH:flavin oxidoreductase [Caulobacteraceae bacterium]